MRWLPIAVAIAAFALVGAGCGGDEESSADTDTVVATDTSATDETTTEETTTEETVTATTDISGIPSADCLQAISAFGVLAQAAAGAGGVDAGDSLETFQAFADSAPDEIQDDLQVLASGYAEYIQTLSELGLEQGEVPDADQTATLAQASEAFNTSEFQTASENWDAWLADNCPG